MPIMWCLANPKLGEREVVAALLEHNSHLIRTGQIPLADKGFSGKGLQTDHPRDGAVGCYDPTARTRPTATATSAWCANGSSRSTRP
jgi:hypothetical protein